MEKVVKVTAVDIEQGKPDDCRACPIALALRRMCPGAVVLVGFGSVDVDGVRFKQTRAISSFIERFDQGERVLPRAFRLSPR